MTAANGTAFAEGNAFSYGSGPSRPSYGTWTGPVSSSSSSNKGSSSSNSSKSSDNTSTSDATEEAEEFLETIDWIEIAIDRVERAISRLDLKASSTFKKWSTRNSSLIDQISEVKKEIDLQQKAYDRYMQQANSVGLSSDYATKVQNGEINIEDITDEDLNDKISQYQNW